MVTRFFRRVRFRFGLRFKFTGHVWSLCVSGFEAWRSLFSARSERGAYLLLQETFGNPGHDSSYSSQSGSGRGFSPSRCLFCAGVDTRGSSLSLSGTCVTCSVEHTGCLFVSDADSRLFILFSISSMDSLAKSISTRSLSTSYFSAEYLSSASFTTGDAVSVVPFAPFQSEMEQNCLGPGSHYITYLSATLRRKTQNNKSSAHPGRRLGVVYCSS